MNRHDMLLFDEAGHAHALQTAAAMNPGLSRAELKRVVTPATPAILRRQETRREGEVEVGFCAPEYRRGTRLRAAARLPLGSITQSVTPFEVAQQICVNPSAAGHALVCELVREGGAYGIEVGVYGSLALEALTGHPYFTDSSDYDLTLRRTTVNANLAAFATAVWQLAAASGKSIDCELEHEGYGVKLREVFAGQRTVLAKGLYEAKLLPAAAVLRGGA